MKILTDKSAIIALSTPANANSAIGIIRISGFSDITYFQSAFSLDLNTIKPRYSHYVSLFDNKKNILDEVILVYYPAPNSYTGENVIELSCHGNQILLNTIISNFLSRFNLRYAEPGEFTYRAMTNGKLSLSQVEGLDLILNATSPNIAEVGHSLLRGDLHQQFHKLYELITHLRSMVDISLDFSEDVGEEKALSLFLESYSNFETFVKALYEKTASFNSALLAPTIVLAGETNAGKSTLFNYLLDNNRSIVSNIAGTTRDFVSETVSISNTHFALIDTAGLRSSEDVIEQEGMRRTEQKISSAFFKILVVHIDKFDISVKDNYDLIIVTHLSQVPNFNDFSHDAQILYVDLLGGPMGPGNSVTTSGPMGPLVYGPIGPPKNITFGPMGPDLKATIFSDISKKYSDHFANDPIVIDRQKRVIEELYTFLVEHREEIVSSEDYGVISYHILHISHLVENLVGIITPDEVLSSIFSNFCIGK